MSIYDLYNLIACLWEPALPIYIIDRPISNRANRQSTSSESITQSSNRYIVAVGQRVKIHYLTYVRYSEAEIDDTLWDRQWDKHCKKEWNRDGDRQWDKQ